MIRAIYIKKGKGFLETEVKKIPSIMKKKLDLFVGERFVVTFHTKELLI